MGRRPGALVWWYGNLAPAILPESRACRTTAIPTKLDAGSMGLSHVTLHSDRVQFDETAR